MVCLYAKTATSFDDNGICVLDPTVCKVSEKAGGSYELYLEHPLDPNGKHALIDEDMVIKAPIPHTVIPAVTLPAFTRYTVNAAADFYKKLPVYKNNNTKDALAEIREKIRQGSTIYNYASTRGYNSGAYTVYNGGIYQALTFAMNVTPGFDSGVWRWVAPLYGDSPTTKPTYTPGETYSPALTVGSYVTKLADFNTVYVQIRDTLGRVGYIDKTKLTAYDTVSETIPEQVIDEQTFRIYQVESDEDTHILKVYARHISYDFQGNSLMDCNLTETKATDAIAIMQGVLMIPDDRRIACEYADDTITKDWSFKNPVNALLDPDNGLVPALNARLIRNNRDFFILKNDEPRTGITIEHGNNMTGVTWNKNNEGVITRVVPRCSSGKDEYLYLEHGGTWSSQTEMTDENWVPNNDIYVESPKAGDFAHPRIEVMDCNFSVGEKYKPTGSDTEVTRDEASCRAEMLKLAKERFTIDLCDTDEFTLTVQFVLLGDTEQFRQYKNLQYVNLYDRITVRTSMIEKTAQVTEYEYDSLMRRYESITVGNVDGRNSRIPGYRVVNESITYSKLSPDLVNRIRTMNGSQSSDSGSTGEAQNDGQIDIYRKNTKTEDGIVTKGQGQASKVWKTDAQGNPDWREEAAGSATDGDPTLAWSTRSKVGTVNGTDLHVTMPERPAYPNRAPLEGGTNESIVTDGEKYVWTYREGFTLINTPTDADTLTTPDEFTRRWRGDDARQLTHGPVNENIPWALESFILGSNIHYQRQICYIYSDTGKLRYERQGIYTGTGSTGFGWTAWASDEVAIDALNSNLKELDSNSNTTNDILADALSATETRFYKGGGNHYTGTLPSTGSFKYGSFMVNRRDSARFVFAMDLDKNVAINVHDGSSWKGWELLASKSNLSNKVRAISIGASDNISLASLLSGSSADGSKNIVMFSCVNNLATDMPQSANKYGTGILIDSGYYNSAYYFADDHKLYIGKKAYSGSWSWYAVQMTAVS